MLRARQRARARYADDDVNMIVVANVIAAALGNGKDIVGVVDLAWTRRNRKWRRLDLSAVRVGAAARSQRAQLSTPETSTST